MNDKYITVTQLTRYIKYKIDNDVNLNEVFLKGEISNFKAHSRGHYYFTLKDEGSRINAIMFASSTKNLKFVPTDGMKVLVTGKISVFEANGAYQIYVNDMLEDGVGNLYIAYEQLKKKLEEEGLFREEHKKKIPKIPKRVGVVTAPTGAAIKDIISTIKRRWPLTEIYLFPSLVQGEDAKDDIVKQIKRAEDYDLDTLIVGRGGGSIEDLWPFNEEIVAREIYNCKIPVISAVGHEIDFTISDFVADLRAPTPTGAAEMAVPNLVDLKTLINQYTIRLNENIKGIINLYTKKLDSLKSTYVLKNPLALYEDKEQKLDSYIDRANGIIKTLLDIYTTRLNNIKSSYVLKNPLATYEVKKEKLINLSSILNKEMNVILDNNKHKYEIMINKLDLLSPLNILGKGYSVVSKDDKVVKSTKNLKVNDILNIRMSEGKVNAIVKEIV